MSTQRYCWVQDFISQDQSIKSVTDIGCSYGRMVIWLKHIANLELINCIDKDLRTIEDGLETNFQPNLFEMLFGRKNSEKRLDIKVYHGDIVVPDDRLKADCFTMVEFIEHIPLDHLERVCQTVFAYYKPRYVIVTTPNAEFNPLIDLHSTIRKKLQELKEQEKKLQLDAAINADAIRTIKDSISTLELQLNSPAGIQQLVVQSPPRYRHSDHKFEWNRAEFAHWASFVARTYCYEVSFGGVGKLPGSEPLGPCTQIALFTRSDNNTSQTGATMEDPALCFDLLINKLSVQESEPEFLGDASLRRVCLRAQYHIPGTPADSTQESEICTKWSDTQDDGMIAT